MVGDHVGVVKRLDRAVSGHIRQAGAERGQRHAGSSLDPGAAASGVVDGIRTTVTFPVQSINS